MVRVLAVLLVAAWLATAEAVVRIRAHTEVSAPRATLADLADIQADPAIAARLAEVLVIAELSVAAPVTVDARLVTAVATRAAAPARLRIEGRGTVARAARTVGIDELVAMVAAVVGPDASTQLLRVSGTLTVPAGPGVVLIAEPLDQALVGEVPFRVRAVEDGRDLGRALVVVRIERTVAVTVAARHLPRGTILGPGDLRTESRQAVRGPRAAAEGVDPQDLVGRELRRDLAAGEPVSPHMAVEPPAVRAGATVTAVHPGRGFAIEVEATALADARAGERLRLRRTSDRSLLTGVAQGDGTVLIER